ncbi:MAG: hypothetical protein IJN06_00775 [Bacteroidales bacterium]|nr:hypothetical protein [Bacteroidales bacterium]
MIKRLLILSCAVLLCVCGYAQENGPQKGDITVAATVGYNSFVSHNAPTVTTNASYNVTALSTDWFDNKLMVGIDGNWFFSEKWSLRFGGGLGYTNFPGYAEKIGTFDEDSFAGDGSVPTYDAVAEGYAFKYNVYAGFDRYFNHNEVKNLYFHVGVHAGVAYSLNELDSEEYSSTSMGISVGEAVTMRGAINAGVDYYFLPAMFVGLEVNALQYSYNMTTIKPQAGLANLSADSHNFGFLAAPTLKIGFKF